MNKYAALSSPQAQIDLHAHTKAEAVKACREFIQNAVRNGMQRVLIITGKGLHSSDNKAVIKPAIQATLRAMSEVQNVADARRDRGGGGALEVLLEVQGNNTKQKNR